MLDWSLQTPFEVRSLYEGPHGPFSQTTVMPGRAGGDIGGGGGSGILIRGPQSSQSVPYGQYEFTAPGPPSWQ